MVNHSLIIHYTVTESLGDTIAKQGWVTQQQKHSTTAVHAGLSMRENKVQEALRYAQTGVPLKGPKGRVNECFNHTNLTPELEALD